MKKKVLKRLQIEARISYSCLTSLYCLLRLSFCFGKGREPPSPTQSFQVGRFWEGPTHNKFSLHAVPRPTSVFGGGERSPVYRWICLSKTSRTICEFPRETRSVKIFPGMGREGSGKIPRTKMFVGLHLKFYSQRVVFPSHSLPIPGKNFTE